MALDDIFNLWLRGLSWRFVCLSGPSLKELRQEKVGDQTEIVHHQIAPRAISSWAEIEKQPYFLPTTTVITIQEGGHAFFTCKVENLYNQTVICIPHLKYALELWISLLSRQLTQQNLSKWDLIEKLLDSYLNAPEG